MDRAGDPGASAAPGGGERRADSDEPPAPHGRGRGRGRNAARLRNLRRRSHSADDTRRDDRGWTALHVASHTGSVDQVKELLAGGAAVNAQSLGPKHPGATPLHLAAAGGHVGVMDILLERGADIEARTHGSFGWTPLHLAAKGDRQKAVRFLVKNGAFLAPEMTDFRFNPPLHYFRGKGLEFAYECQKKLPLL